MGKGKKMKKQPLLNINVNNLSLSETLCAIDFLIQRGKPSYLVEVNVDVIVKAESDFQLKKIIQEADLVLTDGMPLVWVSGRGKTKIKEKVSGSDLVPEVLKNAEKNGYSVYFLGGRKEVLERAVDKVRKLHPNIRIAGFYSPPPGFETKQEELEQMNCQIRKAKPDILFAFLGCPKQEKWIYDNYKYYRAGISICAGATVDFLAGEVKRAPKWMSDHGLEWFYRFCMEPRRLFKRYFIDDTRFLWLIWKYRKRRKR